MWSTALILLLKQFICRGTKTGSTHCYGICYGPFSDKSNAFSSFLTEPLADKSNAFPSFLTVSRKRKYSFLYIFHITYPEEWIWILILSQTKMFSIFPSFIQQSSIMSIILSNCIRERLFATELSLAKQIFLYILPI